MSERISTAFSRDLQREKLLDPASTATLCLRMQDLQRKLWTTLFSRPKLASVLRQQLDAFFLYRLRRKSIYAKVARQRVGSKRMIATLVNADAAGDLAARVMKVVPDKIAKRIYAQILACRDGLVRGHLRLMYSVSVKYATRAALAGLTIHDVFNESVVGLYIASSRFCPRKGAFSTFASLWCHQVIKRYLQHHRSLVHIPCNAQWGPALDKARESGFIVSTWGVTQDSYGRDIFDTIPSVETEIEERVSQAERGVHLSQAVDMLTPREKQVIVGRFYKGDTLATLGNTLNLTRERIRQIEGNALRKMRRYYSRVTMPVQSGSLNLLPQDVHTQVISMVQEMTQP